MSNGAVHTTAPAAPADLARLVTEQPLTGYDNLDSLSTVDQVRLMNELDATVPAAVAAASAQIAAAVDGIAARIAAGGRMIYMGAGSAGRIGILDASECAPTFGTTDNEVVALIAGGPAAVITAAEGAEDSVELAVADLDAINVSAADAVVAISASGVTPYAVGGLRHAASLGALAIGVSCNAATPLSAAAGIAIEVIVGPEIITGSTRLKAGTAQKLVCNQLSTLTMVRLGRTYGNLMVNLTASNAKLWSRAHRLVSTITGHEDGLVDTALRDAGGSVPIAVIMLSHNIGAEPAKARLAAAPNLRSALSEG